MEKLKTETKNNPTALLVDVLSIELEKIKEAVQGSKKLSSIFEVYESNSVETNMESAKKIMGILSMHKNSIALTSREVLKHLINDFHITDERILRRAIDMGGSLGMTDDIGELRGEIFGALKIAYPALDKNSTYDDINKIEEMVMKDIANQSMSSGDGEIAA